MSNKVLETPECIECFRDITEHSNNVLNTVKNDAKLIITEIRSEATLLFNKLEEKQKIHLTEQNNKLDKFIEKREIKYDELEKRLEEKDEKRDERNSKIASINTYFTIAIATILSGIVGYTFLNGQGKANANDVLSLENSYILRTLGDKYYDQRYVLREGETIDKYTYQWHMKIIYKKISRGEEINDSIMPMQK